MEEEKWKKLRKKRKYSVNYIINLIECVMNHSYLKQPTGTYKTLNGFSMGDCSAARGSETILKISELKIFK